MKRRMKKVLAYVLAVVMVCSLGMGIPQTAERVQAASKVYWNPYSNFTYTYKPGDNYKSYSTTLSIMGCEKKSEIKSLKSSNKSVCKVEPRDGYVRVLFGDKAGKSTISCTVKGVKLKKVFTVKKYSNPLSSFKLGTTNFTSKFNTTDIYRQKKSFKSKTLSLKAKKGWTISSVSVTNSKYQNYKVNKTSFTKKISLTSSSAYVNVILVQKSTGIVENLILRKSLY